jgi:adenylate kinase
VKYRAILIFGAPGSGKSTHGRSLGVIPGFFHCASGDVFRSQRPDSPLGKIFLEYSSRGELVPDQPTIELWRHFIESNTKSGQFHPGEDTLVLDGIPRNVPQAEMLSDALNVVALFYLTANRENLIARMQRRAIKDNRLDDANLDVIRQRFKTYEKETKPVINFYGKKLVHRINTDQSPVKTFFDILKHVVKIHL